jgi:Protein of unknown function (DUF3667)
MSDLHTPARPGAVRVPRISRKTPHEPCRNCGDATRGNYCPQCGQRKLEVRVSMRRMLMEALEDQFSLNSALPRTLGALFLRPGRLTSEYMAGRIARYIPPFRLYLVSSLVFFLVLSLAPEVREPVVIDGPGEGTNGRVVVSDSTRSGIRFQVTEDDTAAAPDSAGRRESGWLNVGWNTGNPTLDAMMRQRQERLNRMEPREALREVTSGFLEHVPQMMFLMLPVFAAMLKVLYARRKRYYVEHFVFALHLHSFAFLSFVVMLVARVPAVASVLTLWIFLYVFLAMKRVYGQGWMMTLLKYGVLGISYFVLMSFASVATVMITLLLM